MQLELPFLCTPELPSESRQIPSGAQPGRPGPPLIEFVRVRRATRYILRVRPDGTLRVTVPRGGSRREAQEFAEQQRRWIERERQRIREEHAPPEWRDGSRLLLRGVVVSIRVERGADDLFAFYGDRRVRVKDAGDLRVAIEADLKELAHQELVPRLYELAAEHGFEPRGVAIRNQRSRWGSCSRNGKIALNFRLVQMPPEIRDYVILHELMHIKQQNHSRRYWRLIESACPGFREAERWLRTEGKSLF